MRDKPATSAPAAPASIVEDVVYFSVPGAFLGLSIMVLVPLLMNEPYGRSLVGVNIDYGSRLFTMTSPMLLRLVFIFGSIIAVAYAVVRAIMSTGAYKSLLEGRIWPAGIKARLA